MEIGGFKPTEAETDGIWIECEDGLSLKIARSNNPHFRQEVRKQSRLRMRGGMPSTKDLESITRVAMAKHVLLGWKGLTENGVEIPYSSAKAEELFKEFPNLFDLVSSLSNDVELFRGESLSDAEGN